MPTSFSCIFYTREREDLPFIHRGFLLSGGAEKPQECLVAFQGFTAPPDGKKTGAGVANLCALGYNMYRNRHFNQLDLILFGLKK
jgi:hypothetical protein